MLKTKFKNMKGITLIALVITIVVLLILAGVSISMLTGQNGILTQVQNAKKETEATREDELRRLTALEAATNLENSTYEDKNKQTAPVPAGFAVSQVEGENVIENGLVIIDSKGNEFVWIPVTDEAQYKRNTNYERVEVSQAAYTDTGYLPEGIQPATDNATDNENAEKVAVTSKGGFYISRYEAGKEGTNTLVSKKGANVWNKSPQTDCKKIAKTFINNKNIKSALCSGIQWDVTMDFVNEKLDGTNGIFDVTTYSDTRHAASTMAAGQNEADKVCNIYDLEGNYLEYVSEKNNYDVGNLFVYRGGISRKFWYLCSIWSTL